jgi:hypothetical protein
MKTLKVFDAVVDFTDKEREIVKDYVFQWSVNQNSYFEHTVRDEEFVGEEPFDNFDDILVAKGCVPGEEVVLLYWW